MKNANRFLRLGMTALLLASVLNLLSRRMHGAGEAWFDFGMGFLYAIAIGLLLLFVRMRARQRGDTCS
jgi:hypothetical protein